MQTDQGEDVGIKSSTKGEKLVKYMIDTLKEMFQTLRYPEYGFTKSGIITTVILILISVLFIILPGLDSSGGNLSFNLTKVNLLAIPISFVVAFVVIYLWFLLGLKITPKTAHLLVDNKVLKFLFTKGNVHYLEYIPEEKRKIASPHILNKYIALILAWVSSSAFLMSIVAGLIADNDPRRILYPGNDILLFLIRTLILFGLVPLIFTLIYPLSWMLIDAKLKAYHSGTKLNWLVGKKVASITGGFITLGAIFGLGANVLAETTFAQIQIRAGMMIGLVLFCIINVSLIVTLVSFFYNIFFQGRFYKEICDSIDVGFAITSVTMVDADGNPIETKDEPKTKVVEEESETFEVPVQSSLQEEE
ncbi:MAG: hypothetical protein ACTSPV_16595 [Candidatus Hodarchaeales archaeon]